MHSYKQNFIQFALEHEVLRFGEFTLKSGRKSPYFFNAGLFNSGEALAKIGQFYAQAINASGIPFSMLFGPAYKGIPLVVATSIAFAREHQQDIPYCFNRKEMKSHGENSLFVGSPLQGEVLILDDVITAGTAIREAMALISNSGAKVAGIMTLLDRQEKGLGDTSAIKEIEKDYGIPVLSIIKLEDLLQYLKDSEEYGSFLPAIEEYRERYGVS